MAYDFILDQGRRNPVASFVPSDGKGNLIPFVNFSGASILFVLYDDYPGTPVLSAAGTITPYTDGIHAQFNYVWQPGDVTLPAATYMGKFIVTYSNGSNGWFPNPEFLSVLAVA